MIFRDKKNSRLQRGWIWLRRCRHSRGFGVQSPWAYSLIRYVINEHYPYYAYDELMGRFPSAPAISRKLGKLYFRLSNHVHGRRWGMLTGDVPLKRAYVEAGCKAATVSDLSAQTAAHLASAGCCDVLVVSLKSDVEQAVSAFMTAADAHGLLIVEDIHDTRQTRRMWRDIVAHPRAGVSFDLYYCGMVFFDRNRFKQAYRVNF